MRLMLVAVIVACSAALCACGSYDDQEYNEMQLPEDNSFVELDPPHVDGPPTGCYFDPKAPAFCKDILIDELYLPRPPPDKNLANPAEEITIEEWLNSAKR